MEKQTGGYSSDNNAYTPDDGGFRRPPQQQGYHPQHQGYPPQQQGYPPQQHGHPQQQGHPQQGFAQQGGYPMQQQQYPAGPNVVVTQPIATTFVTRPNDYFVFSLLTCLFCFWPTGIAALIFSCNSREANDRMDYNAAESNGRNAKILSIVSLSIGLIWIIGLIIWAITFSVRLSRLYY